MWKGVCVCVHARARVCVCKYIHICIDMLYRCSLMHFCIYMQMTWGGLIGIRIFHTQELHTTGNIWRVFAYAYVFLCTFLFLHVYTSRSLPHSYARVRPIDFSGNSNHDWFWGLSVSSADMKLSSSLLPFIGRFYGQLQNKKQTKSH